MEQLTDRHTMIRRSCVLLLACLMLNLLLNTRELHAQGARPNITGTSIPFEQSTSRQREFSGEPVSSNPKNSTDPESIELKKPTGSIAASTGTKPSTQNLASSTIPALACCLVMMLIFWMIVLSLKKKTPLAAPVIPSEALEFLGRKAIDLRSTIYYLRCGNRILIIGQSDAGLQTLGEVNDPLEVDIISGLCRAEKSRETNLADSFKTLFLRSQPSEAVPQPAASLRDRLQKPAGQSATPAFNREGRKSA